MPKVDAVDFFCGAGGLTNGLISAGINVILGIDNDGDAESTYSLNNNVPFWRRDLWSLRFSELKHFLQNRNSQASYLLFAGCAPCQPFSKINRASTCSEDAELLIRFAEFIVKFRPHFVLSENVPQILRHEHVFSKFLAMLDSAGYHVSYELVNAKFHNVPQTRIRLVLLASRLSKLALPAKSESVCTVRDAISHLPPLAAGSTHSKISNHCCMSLSSLNLKRIRATPHDGGDSRSWPKRLLLRCHRNTEGYYDVYGRMSWDKPAPTLTTRCISYSNGRFGHPEQDRAITLREAAAIQSFPDSFTFYGTQTNIGRLVGNAVPPKLAEALGRQIVKSLERQS